MRASQQHTLTLTVTVTGYVLITSKTTPQCLQFILISSALHPSSPPVLMVRYIENRTVCFGGRTVDERFSWDKRALSILAVQLRD